MLLSSRKNHVQPTAKVAGNPMFVPFRRQGGFQWYNYDLTDTISGKSAELRTPRLNSGIQRKRCGLIVPCEDHPLQLETTPDAIPAA